MPTRTHGVYTSKADLDEGTITGLTVFGTATGSTVGFFGTTPAARPNVTNNATITATWVTISDGAQGFGFSTSDQIISVIAVIKQMQHVLTTLGLWE